MSMDPKSAVTENDIAMVREAFVTLRNRYRLNHADFAEMASSVEEAHETEKRILAHLNPKDPNATA